MRHARRIRWAAPLIGAALLTTAACGSSSSSTTNSTSTTTPTGTQAAANAAVCSAVTGLKSSLTAFGSLATTTSQAQFATLTANVVSAWATLEAAAKSATGIDTTQLRNAVNNFESTMTSLPGKHLSFSQDVAQARAAIVPVAQAAQNVAPNCGGSATSTTGS